MQPSRTDIEDGMVLIFSGQRRLRFWPSKGGIAKILKMDEVREVAHLRLYRQTDGLPDVLINHLPVTLGALTSSVQKLIGVQPGEVDSETRTLIKAWESKFEARTAAAYSISVSAARDCALESIAKDALVGPNSAILTSFPIAGQEGRYTRIETLVGRLLQG